MKLRALVDFHHLDSRLKAGDLFERADHEARALLARGLAEDVEAAAPAALELTPTDDELERASGEGIQPASGNQEDGAPTPPITTQEEALRVTEEIIPTPEPIAPETAPEPSATDTEVPPTTEPGNGGESPDPAVADAIGAADTDGEPAAIAEGASADQGGTADGEAPE